MQGGAAAAQPPRQEQPQRNKQLIFIIFIYLMFTMFSHLTSDSTAFNKNIIGIIANPLDVNPLPKIIMNLFSANNYVGNWHGNNKIMSILDKGEGKTRMKFQNFQTLDINDYQFQFQLNNGRYIDDGNILIKTVISLQKLQAIRNNTSVIIKLKQSNISNETSTNKTNKTNATNITNITTNTTTNTTNITTNTTTNTTNTTNTTTNTTNITNTTALFYHEKILRSIEQKSIILNKFNLILSYNTQKKSLGIVFSIGSMDNFEAEIVIQKQQSIMVSTIIFAIILFVISYMEFSALMEMLKSIFDGRQSAQSYSIVTVLIATHWDAVVCVVAFIQAFGNQESLILFIMPAFILCLLFMNLQLRVLLMIFQAQSDHINLGQVACRFNVITYGSLTLLYPLMKITNLSSFVFLLISLIFIPQIYQNAWRGKRPNIENDYYSRFLTVRFLLILYLKCFPWNIFDLEPNYLVSFSCIALLAFQIFLLWIQKQYGPKKVIPKFLLPPLFNYQCANQVNIEEGAEAIQCAICLTNIYQDPQVATGSLNTPFRIMKGPCGHKFHGACLTKWMQIKMQCPHCRGKLPPFQ